MANDRNDGREVSGARPGGGPDADDAAYEQNAAERRDPHAQSDMQATAETEDPHRAVADRTGTAVRAEAAAGSEVDANARDDADRAFEQSRGNHEVRERPTDRS